VCRGLLRFCGSESDRAALDGQCGPCNGEDGEPDGHGLLPAAPTRLSRRGAGSAHELRDTGKDLRAFASTSMQWPQIGWQRTDLSGRRHFLLPPRIPKHTATTRTMVAPSTCSPRTTANQPYPRPLLTSRRAPQIRATVPSHRRFTAQRTRCLPRLQSLHSSPPAAIDGTCVRASGGRVRVHHPHPFSPRFFSDDGTRRAVQGSVRADGALRRRRRRRPGRGRARRGRVVRVAVRHADAVHAVYVLYERGGRQQWTDLWGGPGGELRPLNSLPVDHDVVSRRRRVRNGSGARAKLVAEIDLDDLPRGADVPAPGRAPHQRGRPLQRQRVRGQLRGALAHAGHRRRAYGPYGRPGPGAFTFALPAAIRRGRPPSSPNTCLPACYRSLAPSGAACKAGCNASHAQTRAATAGAPPWLAP
jgi:hypothetical protein